MADFRGEQIGRVETEADNIESDVERQIHALAIEGINAELEASRRSHSTIEGRIDYYEGPEFDYIDDGVNVDIGVSPMADRLESLRASAERHADGIDAGEKVLREMERGTAEADIYQLYVEAALDNEDRAAYVRQCLDAGKK